MLSAASCPPLHKTQERGTHSFGAGSENRKSKGWATRPRIKEIRPDYRTAVNVITFEHFFQFHLDPAMQRWRAAGVVE
jgi:hypothetical protein